jgi:predicted kinase
MIPGSPADVRPDDRRRVLVIVSGLPGAGKSAVADALGRHLGAPVLSVDPIEAAIWRCGIAPSWETGVAAYEVAAVLAEQQLRLGLSAIVDAVSSLEVARDMFRQVARRAGAVVRVIEVVCSDHELHRTRLGHRVRDIEGFPEPSWQEVLARRDEWEPWADEHLVLDSVAPLSETVARALHHLRG